MNILYLISSFEGGGAGFSIPAMKDVFEAQGHNLTVLALEPKDMKTAEVLAQHNIPHDVLCQSRSNKLSYILKLVKYLQSHPTDLIWCSLNQACLVGSIAGAIKSIPTVCFKQTDILHWYTKLTWKLPRFWVADSLAIQEWLIETSNLPKEKLLLWPLFIADPKLPSARIPSGHRFNLLSIGRLHKMKNYSTLIRALALVEDRDPSIYKQLHLTIIGEGPARTELEKLILSLGLSKKVSLTGHVSQDKVQDFVINSDCYIQPSHNEGMCIALHEAMSQGLPAIVSPVGQMRHAVTNKENGIVLQKNTADEIAEAIIELLSDTSALESMGRAARKMIQNTYSAKNFSLSGKKVIEQITSSMP